MNNYIHFPRTKIMAIHKVLLAKILDQRLFNFTQSLEIFRARSPELKNKLVLHLVFLGTTFELRGTL